ncbi:MAG: hypothetical protein BWY85_00213 [Firmicutes bacterium ADurb.Bin506]|nr:MAG: hypothetical protein BWY85_00213 [Firmicutes bacterium ADurb.Bin506]
MPATLNANGDVIVEAQASYKARLEVMTIDNTDTNNKVITLLQSLRLVAADGTMGAKPILLYPHGFTLAELVGLEFDGITFLQVMTWIQKWAISVNMADADKMVALLTPAPPPVVEPAPGDQQQAEDPYPTVEPTP